MCRNSESNSCPIPLLPLLHHAHTTPSLQGVGQAASDLMLRLSSGRCGEETTVTLCDVTHGLCSEVLSHPWSPDVHEVITVLPRP